MEFSMFCFCIFLSISIYLLLVSFVNAPVARVVRLNLVALRTQAAHVFHSLSKALHNKIVLQNTYLQIRVL